MTNATQVLHRTEQDNALTPKQLLPLVYDELLRLAAAKISQEAPGQTLQANGLVHEAYMKLASSKTNRSYRNRRHFIAVAATAMRQILVDRARAKQATKRGGGMKQKPLTDVAADSPNNVVLDLLEALTRLKSKDPLKAELVELRYFAGLTGDQAAEELGISPSSADRHWVFARDWLKNEVHGM